jgi:predicted NBD/HSP70 family sugar kinase
VREVFVVADMGGTWLRSGYVATGSRQVAHRTCEPVQGIASLSREDVSSVQQRVVTQLIAALRRLVKDAPVPVAGVGVAFAGPVDGAGDVSDAPTVWGPRGPRLALAALLTRQIGRPVALVNDVAAAGCRYVEQEDEDFCIVTVSSGLGNKVFRNGAPLLHPLGLGGEIGHLRVDLSSDALRCDCGEPGHLAAIASGRGVLNCVRRAAIRSPGGFDRSLLHEACAGDPATLTSEHVAAAICHDDPFAVDALHIGLAHLAGVLATICGSIGVRRFVFVGGFARAVGEPYIAHLGDELRRLGCFGIPRNEVAAMLRLGAQDDDDGLVGCARHLERVRLDALVRAGDVTR